MAERQLMLVLHDVAPETWPDYKPFVEAVDALGGVPISWLVVPDFHGRNALLAHPDFCRLLDERLARGDELVLHGYQHRDVGTPLRSPRDWFMRRVYTHEGEFYALSESEALARLNRGMALFERLGWPLHGFVAPAWLMSDGTRRALARSGLSYTSDPGHLYRLPDFQTYQAPGLVWSARSAWRRGLSRLYNDHLLQRVEQAPLVRFGLHPVDMRHAFSRDYWFERLVQMLDRGRQPVAKHVWMARQRLAAGAVA